MKTKLLLFACLVFALCSACSSDDEAKEGDYNNIAGSWKITSGDLTTDETQVWEFSTDRSVNIKRYADGYITASYDLYATYTVGNVEQVTIYDVVYDNVTNTTTGTTSKEFVNVQIVTFNIVSRSTDSMTLKMTYINGTPTNSAPFRNLDTTVVLSKVILDGE